MNYNWLLEDTKDLEFNELKNILDRLNIKYDIIECIPFSDVLLNINENSKYIPYGTVNLIQKILNKYNNKNIHIWSNNDLFDYNILINNYKELFLNYDATITTFDKLLNSNYSGYYFLKPNKTIKSFSGALFDLDHITSIYENLSANNYLFDKNLEIIISSEKIIDIEYRLFIMNNKIISGSQYYKYSKLNINPYIPSEIIEFGYKCIQTYNPLPYYILDIGIHKKKPYIIELNCFNCSGFYKSDIEKIIKCIY